MTHEAERIANEARGAARTVRTLSGSDIPYYLAAPELQAWADTDNDGWP